MKIFAKRKRKESSEGTTRSPKERTSFASDPIVEDLLRRDPSSWNSKEKRMVKRYQKRKEQAGEDYDSKSEKAELGEKVSEKGSPTAEASRDEEGLSGQAAEELKKTETSHDDESDSSDSDSSDSEKSNGNETDEIASEVEAVKNGKRSANSEPATDCDKVDPSHEVFKILEQLNSKMKRTLSRKLDRQGVSALKEVQLEASRLLENTRDSSKKRGHDKVDSAADSDAKGNSKKKGRKADWSALPPEERLRRQEQRRLQEEAAERRRKGDGAGDGAVGHKHPLNSERRRANRRKPKWKNTFKREEKKNHHASGFLVRREKSYA
eukprot:scaffold1390_cov138-Cylindrotheca_fusiformis.AAC.4